MNELVKVTKQENGQSVVSARELYDYLDVNSNFTTWCNRMFEYGFEQDLDYLPILEAVVGSLKS